MAGARKRHRNAVDIWVLPRDKLFQLGGGPRDCVSDEERARAARLVQPQDKARFVAFRDALRRVLALYLTISPEDLRFEASAYGKLRIDAGQHHTGIDFNLSHSADLLVVAVSRCGSVGIDIEHVGHHRDIEKLCDRILGHAERSEYETLGQHQQRLAIWRAWTRKEAYLKGVGVGLSKHLEDVRVTLGANVEPRIVSVKERPQDPRLWRLHEFWPAPDVVGTLAIKSATAYPEIVTAEDWNSGGLDD